MRCVGGLGVVFDGVVTDEAAAAAAGLRRCCQYF
jgi:hypothetical protein